MQDKINVELWSSAGNFPDYVHDGDSGMDVSATGFSVWQDEVLVQVKGLQYDIPAGGSVLVHTGLHMSIPKGYECQVRPRSGLALKQQITVLNTPGTVDSNYTGEVGVILINQSHSHRIVKVGDRVAQLVFAPVVKAEFAPVLSKDMLSVTTRADGGFGSTGVQSK